MKNNIRKLREKQGLSQAKLANIIGTDQRYVDRWEKSDDVKIGVALDIAKALKCEVSDLFSDDKLILNNIDNSINPSELLHFVRLAANVGGKSIASCLGIAESDYRKIETSPDLTIDNMLVVLSAILSLWQSNRIFEQSGLWDIKTPEEVDLLRAFRSVAPIQKKQLSGIIQSFLPATNKTKTKSVLND